jgi:hypothetical protein
LDATIATTTRSADFDELSGTVPHFEGYQMNLIVPESVIQYLTDNTVRSAVDAILEGKQDHVPAGLEWKELPEYFLAVLAAQHVKCDWALALHQLYESCWNSKHVLNLKQYSPDEHLNEKIDSPLSIEGLWLEKCYGRYYEGLNEVSHYFFVILYSGQGFSLGYIRYENGVEMSVPKLNDLGFNFDETEMSYRSFFTSVEKLADFHATENLRDFRDAVIALI